MADMLAGIQYRTLKAELPTWNTDKYTDWFDTESLTEFPSGTQFRVTPEYVYRVGSNGKVVNTPSNKDTAMGIVARLVEEGKHVDIKKDERSSPTVSSLLAERNIQFRLGNGQWRSATYMAHHTSEPIYFRVRPDNYWEVTVRTGIAEAAFVFDDANDLTRYLDRQIRTSESDFFVKRRNYGILPNG